MSGMLEIKGDGIGKGLVRGEALVSRSAVSFNNGVEPTNGKVIEPSHELEGECVTDKVLVFPVGKGSAAGSYVLYDLAVRGNAPAAIVNTRSDTIIVIGCVMGKIPMMHRCDRDPVEAIHTGDMVEIDVEAGIIKVFPKQ